MLKIIVKNFHKKISSVTISKEFQKTYYSASSISFKTIEDKTKSKFLDFHMPISLELQHLDIMFKSDQLDLERRISLFLSLVCA